MIRLNISKRPPTVNSMYKNVRRVGRVKTKRYCDWDRLASHELMSQPVQQITTEKYGLVVFINAPSNADLSNYMKPVEDLMVRLQITPDDKNNIFPLTLQKADSGVEICVLDEEEAKTAIKAVKDNLF